MAGAGGAALSQYCHVCSAHEEAAERGQGQHLPVPHVRGASRPSEAGQGWPGGGFLQSWGCSVGGWLLGTLMPAAWPAVMGDLVPGAPAAPSVG